VKKTYEDGTTKNDKRREREKAQALLLRTVYCLSQEREQSVCRVAIDDNEKKRRFCRYCTLTIIPVMLFLCSLPLSILKYNTTLFIGVWRQGVGGNECIAPATIVSLQKRTEIRRGDF